ncbi:ABC transporter permease [Actinospica durhamensis]|uniref:ABC transporter permease n=1 Tax=Actinospica durhamensis TaxID=1508375 RepID=A0A941IT45_9ACTN|nr:ABC transporter permease [Actinospica durhamensis]MBR7837177.1 ABC transporter permease [Actinospica durhamensis]
MNAVLALSRFEVVRATRNRRLVFLTVLYPALLFAMVGKSAKGNVAGTNVSYETYFLISYTSFGVIAAALNNNAMRIAQERKDGWVRQLRLTASPSYGYVTSKVLTSLVIVLPAIVVTFVLGSAMGVKLEASQWLAAFLALWLGSLAFTAMAVAIGYGVPQDSVQMVVLIVFLAGSVLGGQFFPVSGVLQDIGKALPTYWMRQIALDVISKNPVEAKGVAILAAWLVGCSILAAVLYNKRAED